MLQETYGQPVQLVQRELAALHDNPALRLGDAAACNQLHCSFHVYRTPQDHLNNCLDHWFQNDIRLVPAGPTPRRTLLPGCRHGQQQCGSPATLPFEQMQDTGNVCISLLLGLPASTSRTLSLWQMEILPFKGIESVNKLLDHPLDHPYSAFH